MPLSQRILMEECAELNKQMRTKSNIDKLIEKNQHIVSEDVNLNKKYSNIYYIDYKKDLTNYASSINFKSTLIDLKSGITKETILNILTEITLSNANKYIVINCNKILTKRNMDNYDSNVFLLSTNKLIRKNIQNFFIELTKKNVKIIILSLSEFSFLKKFFQYTELDKYVYKYFTPDICNISDSINNEDKMDKQNKINKVMQLLDLINKYVQSKNINFILEETNSLEV